MSVGSSTEVVRPAFLYCWRGCFVVQLKCFSSSDPSMTPVGKIQSLCYMSFLDLKREGFFWIISFPLLPEQMKLNMIPYRFLLVFLIPLVKRECWGERYWGDLGGWHLLSQLLGCQKLGVLLVQFMKIMKPLHDFSVWNQDKILTLPEVSERSCL